MRLHVLGLPHTQTTKDDRFMSCAYTQKTVKWCRMMKSLGHEVILYSGDHNDADVTEHVSCITDGDQARFFDPPYPEATPEFSIANPGFAIFNDAAAREIKARVADDRDVICTLGGLSQATVSERHPDLMTVEYGIGYSGIFSEFKIFESYAWMHLCYGLMNDRSEVPDGQFYDSVIPNFFDIEDFPEGSGSGDYVLYMGRGIVRKGLSIAANACKRAGLRFVYAGSEPDFDLKYGEWAGLVGAKERADLMGNAIAVMAPTVYVEPFGGVTVEANLCGTPVLTTDFGAFTETVQQGHNGWRCRDLGEFVWGLKNLDQLDNREIIRATAQSKYSSDVLKHDYQSYFERAMELHDDGFYTKRERRPGR